MAEKPSFTQPPLPFDLPQHEGSHDDLPVASAVERDLGTKAVLGSRASSRTEPLDPDVLARGVPLIDNSINPEGRSQAAIKRQAEIDAAFHRSQGR